MSAFRSTWRSVTRGLGESLGPRHRDVRRARHVEHGAAHEPRGAADADQREGGERQRQVAEPVGQARRRRQEVGVEPGRAERGQQPQPVGEEHHQHEPEPVAGQGEQGDAWRPRARCRAGRRATACTTPTAMPSR